MIQSLRGEEFSLLDILQKVQAIDDSLKDELPFIQNTSLMAGYLNMPSARSQPSGVVTIGAARVFPYNNYAIGFQYFDRVELSINYRVYTTEKGLKQLIRFKENSEKVGNIKFIFNLPSDELDPLPEFALGIDDFIGVPQFNSQYFVATKMWKKAHLETTLGWGRKRIRGFFGGIAWSPLRQSDILIARNLSLIAEYDHYKRETTSKTFKSHINLGVSYTAQNRFQLSLASYGGKELLALGSLKYPLGTSEGFLSKTNEPAFYHTPQDQEPLGVTRREEEFIHELGYVLGQQGFDLYQVYYSEPDHLWIKIINNMYREEPIVRERVQKVLAAITPSNIERITVMIEADGVLCQGYDFRTQDLYKYREGSISSFEMETLSPMRDGRYYPTGASPLYKRKKEVWLLTLRPRIQTFFGTSTGNIQYNLSLIGAPEGYLFDQIYYQLQLGYSVKSSVQNTHSTEWINPSKLPHVRTDNLRYFQSNTLSLEIGYLQKSWHLGRGIFFRLAGGYFEPAYGGGALEALYYPVDAHWAFGVEQATLVKRKYRGLGFTHYLQTIKHHKIYEKKFLGMQYFGNIYYTIKSWNLDCKISIGQFLAKDRGIRMEINRWFPSGLQVSLWYTITNGHDHVNKKVYYDKGFGFYIPLDFFMKQSSRTYVGYAMSAWLRDVGAVAETGKTLYPTIRLERVNKPF